MKDEATGVVYNTRSDYDKAMWDTFNKGTAQMPVNPTDVSSSKAIQLPGESSITDTATSNLSMAVNAIPPSQLTSKSSEADVQSALGRVTPQEQAQLGYMKQIGDSMKKMLGKADRTTELYEDFGLEKKQKELNDLDKQIGQEKSALENELRRLEKNPSGVFGPGVLTGQMGKLRTESLRRQADLSIIKAGVQGDISTAQSIIQQKLDMEFAPIQEEIQYYSQLLQLSEMESGILDKKEKDQLNFILSERQNAMDEEKAEKKERYNLAAKIAESDPSFARQVISGQVPLSEAYVRSGMSPTGNVSDTPAAIDYIQMNLDSGLNVQDAVMSTLFYYRDVLGINVTDTMLNNWTRQAKQLTPNLQPLAPADDNITKAPTSLADKVRPTMLKVGEQFIDRGTGRVNMVLPITRGVKSVGGFFKDLFSF
jgi:hypothetical protein